MRNVSLVAIFAAAIMSGCTASVKTMPTPDGKMGYQVSCDGSASDWAKCYEGAAKACSNGKYDVVDRDSSSTPTMYGPLVRRTMIISCKS